MDCESGSGAARRWENHARPAPAPGRGNRRDERAVRKRHLLRAREESPMSTVELRQQAPEAELPPVEAAQPAVHRKGKPASCWRGLLALVLAIAGSLGLHLVVGPNEPLKKETWLYTTVLCWSLCLTVAAGV